MKTGVIAMMVFALGSAASYAAQVIDFEDIAISGDVAFPVNGYRGFNWGSTSLGDTVWLISTASGWPQFPGARAHSGENYAWSNGDAIGPLTLSPSIGGTFDLIGFWARWPSGTSPLVARGSLQGNEIYTQTFAVTDQYEAVTLNFVGIDRFQIDRPYGSNLLVDDISVSIVPEASPTTLLVAGLAVVVIATRRRGSPPAD